MSTTALLTGLSGLPLHRLLVRELRDSAPRAVAAASAFVSKAGISLLGEIGSKLGIEQYSIIAGIDELVTQPAALQLAEDNGWIVRVAKGPHGGIFHPKMLLFSDSLTTHGKPQSSIGAYIGSANLTYRGLRSNIECGLFTTDNETLQECEIAFSDLYDFGEAFTDTVLSSYTAQFTKAAKYRQFDKATVLDITEFDSDNLPTLIDARNITQPRSEYANYYYATGVWAGLETLTGGYRFQVEFPRKAGKVLARLLHQQTILQLSSVEAIGPDGKSYELSYRYMMDNSMYRINIPNDFPDVDWVRQHHLGILVLELNEHGQLPFSVRILRPSELADQIVRRSMLLGSWGKTPTRLYGWF